MRNPPRNFRWHELVRQFLGDDFFEEIQTTVNKEEPAADVYHGQNEVIVVINLPGLENIHSMELRIEGENLWLRGDFPTPYQGYSTLLSERKKGKFQKVIPLGCLVSKKYTYARYRRGVLEIRFPKIAARNRSMRIKT
ncbi:Hsp20/alpha crystallin family protein [Thermoactinomyces mirandus]|uniref:Hsp20/alpha crystallin family protein n=1 Tax=Thermoactinomyces mirandus TaxID=2756294 RepID=A0A7W1XQ45_9BACL|nr:Hsp20 family protein [Thermoactinomyces mirandus]MBA4601106.1 Hsp20/alpha crystallin family protein [Thermoactinomyces mirandus]